MLKSFVIHFFFFFFDTVLCTDHVSLTFTNFKNMKKKIFIAMTASVLFAMSFAFNFQGSSNQAFAEQCKKEVSCRCQWFGDDCAANGWGQLCTDHSNCASWNSNCQ